MMLEIKNKVTLSTIGTAINSKVYSTTKKLEKLVDVPKCKFIIVDICGFKTVILSVKINLDFNF